MKITSLTLALSFLLSSASAYSYDSVTAPQLIKSHQSQVSGNTIYVRSLAGVWNATSIDGNSTPCSPQHTVYIPEEGGSGYDEVFSSVLTAAGTGKKVYFYGFCDNPNPGYFKATHINVQY